MPYSVNGQLVPEELIRQESDRIARDRQWLTIADEAERAMRLRTAAECSAADKILIAQVATADPRPVDRDVLEMELQKLRAQRGCRTAIDEAAMRGFIDHQLRVQRTTREMIVSARKPTTEEVENFYKANREQFRKPEMFHAAHILKRVDHEHSEQEAEAGILVALAELERGQPFEDVAALHSDCKDEGGDLGQFPAGYMVQEFEDAIRNLEPGQRTGVFTTPFGFHIAQLLGKTPAGPATFDEVRDEITRVMTFASEHEAFMGAVARLRSRADIRWVPSADSGAG